MWDECLDDWSENLKEFALCMRKATENSQSVR